MKKKYYVSIIFVVLLVFGLMACSKNVGNDVQEANGQDYFNAKVLEVYDTFVSVECLAVTTGAVNEGAEVHVSKKVSSTNVVPDLHAGDKIRVVFTDVMETYPLQLQTVWAIYELDEEGNVIVIDKEAVSDSERDTEGIEESNAEPGIVEVSSEDAKAQNEKEKDEMNWGISLAVEDVTSSGLTLICTQSGGTPTGELQTGSEYKLLVLENDTWKEVPTRLKEYAWDAVAYMLPMNDSREFEINWEWLYGKLAAGTYRITKEIMDFRGTDDYDTATYYVEFEIK